MGRVLTMRDSHNGMPEIIAGFERDGLHFGAVRLLLEDELVSVEFGLDETGYVAIRRILQSRPFGVTGMSYKYFFAKSYSRVGSETVRFSVRVESGKDAKQFEFDGPAALVANLLWFGKLQDQHEVSFLKRFPGN